MLFLIRCSLKILGTSILAISGRWPGPWRGIAMPAPAWSGGPSGWMEREKERIWGTYIPGWWFGTIFVFQYNGNNHPKWLIFFRWVETTNQIRCSLGNMEKCGAYFGVTPWVSQAIVDLGKKISRPQPTTETHGWWWVGWIIPFYGLNSG